MSFKYLDDDETHFEKVVKEVFYNVFGEELISDLKDVEEGVNSDE